jgi:hypothetical protein
MLLLPTQKEIPMNRLSMWLFIALAPSIAWAQNTPGFPGDVAPYPVDGKLVTGGYDHYESPPISSMAENVFMYEFAQLSDDPNFTDDPGFDNLAGFPTLPIGEPLNFELTTKLYYWDGNGPVSFSPAPTTAQLVLSLGSNSLDITGESVTGKLTTIQVSNSIGRLHTHLGATIGDSSPQGIYMIGMKLSMPGLIDSDPIAIMYNDLQTLLTSPNPDDFAKAEMIGQTGANWTQENLGIVGIAGDVNGDGVVNGLDINLAATNWLKSGSGIPGDANGDGVINGLDINLIATHWLDTFTPTSGGGSAVPEPSTLALGVIGGAALIAVARRRACNRGNG